MDSNTTNNGDNTMNTDTNIPESFKQFLASGESVIQTCRELMAENERLRKINDDVQRVFKDHGIHSADNLRLYLEGNGAEPPADYQTLKDFKGEMDAIHEEFDIPHDVDALRKDLKMGKDIADMIEANTDVDFSVDTWAKDLQEMLDDYNAYKQACDNHMVEPHDLDSTLEEKDQLDNVLSDHDISDASDLDDTLTGCEDAKAYEKGFDELAEFVEQIKEVVGNNGEDIPATDMEDYK